LLERRALQTFIAITSSIDFIARIGGTLAAKYAFIAFGTLRIFSAPIKYEILKTLLASILGQTIVDLDVYAIIFHIPPSSLVKHNISTSGALSLVNTMITVCFVGVN
jgi:tetrahydromethanopterin S-methyltransferase subunit C